MALVNLFGDIALESTMQSILANLSTPVTDLPHEPTDDTSDLTYIALTRVSSGESTISAAVAAQSTRLHRYEFTCSGPCTVEVLLGSAGTSVRKHVMPAAGGYTADFWTRPYAVTALNQALILKTTGNVQVDAQFSFQRSVPS